MSIIDKIEEIVTPVITRNGCSIVRIAMHSIGKTKKLQIMIEKLDETPITIDDCEIVSKDVSAILDVEDIIKYRYVLEISSAGIDRPLVKPADFQRFTNKNVVIKTFSEKNGQKVFNGIILYATNDLVQIKLAGMTNINENNVVEFDYSEIKFAHIDGAKEL